MLFLLESMNTLTKYHKMKSNLGYVLGGASCDSSMGNDADRVMHLKIRIVKFY